jgi:hypothetical protein
MKMSSLDRALILLMSLLAAYQIVVGIDKMDSVPIIAYTIAFGVLLVAGLLLIILGFDALESPVVVIVSTIIPLALATGLVYQYLASFQTLYLLFAIGGFLAVTFTRSMPMKKRSRVPVMTIAIVHGVAGLTIFLLPILTSVRGETHPLFTLVGIGGALIGIGGLLLSFLKTGRPILSREKIFKILPGLFLLMTVCFVAGFKYG